MKKLLITLMMIACAVGLVSAKDNYAHDASVLPRPAQTMIKKNFKARVGVVKIDKDFGRVSEYELTLTNGSEIVFDRDGNWKDIETNIDSQVPQTFIPANTRSYIKANHKGQRVVGIEKERNGYEITLSNGIDLKVDQNGNFVKYD